MLGVGKLSTSHFGGVLGRRVDRDLRNVRVAFGELRLELVEYPQKIENQQQLAGPAQVATDAYRESWDRTFGAGRRRSSAPPN